MSWIEWAHCLGYAGRDLIQKLYLHHSHDTSMLESAIWGEQCFIFRAVKDPWIII